jgi:broad specificity phosphatase PhoE
MTVLLVRHARAGSRKHWEGADIERPLSKKGWRQAEGLVDMLSRRPIKRILSSPFVRCVQTVQPLAEKLGLEIERRPELAEGAPVDAALELVRDAAGTTVVLCTHGDIVPSLLDVISQVDRLDLPDDVQCPKGSVWELEQDRDGRVTEARYLPAPDPD